LIRWRIIDAAIAIAIVVVSAIGDDVCLGGAITTAFLTISTLELKVKLSCGQQA
jgi:hypothetical protein